MFIRSCFGSWGLGNQFLGGLGTSGIAYETLPALADRVKKCDTPGYLPQSEIEEILAFYKPTTPLMATPQIDYPY